MLSLTTSKILFQFRNFLSKIFDQLRRTKLPTTKLLNEQTDINYTAQITAKEMNSDFLTLLSSKAHYSPKVTCTLCIFVMLHGKNECNQTQSRNNEKNFSQESLLTAGMCVCASVCRLSLVPRNPPCAVPDLFPVSGSAETSKRLPEL